MIATAERRAYVLAQRKGGYTYAQIARMAIEKFKENKLPAGWDERYAYKDVQRELQRLREETKEEAADLVQLEIERLDAALKAVAPKVQQGHLGAIDRWIRLSESRRKLLGLDAPERQKIDGALVMRVIYDSEVKPLDHRDETETD